MLNDEDIDDYIRYLWEHLPPAQAHLSIDQVRTVLDTETAYYQRRFGSPHGLRGLLRSIFKRPDPAPETVEAELPAFEAYVVAALAERRDITVSDIRAIMAVEGQDGPRWVQPEPEPDPPVGSLEIGPGTVPPEPETPEQRA